ncbi:MAG: F0F1 ATP synthase subunit A [Ignavibacteria bacterium]|nr:F0F1 ATP synthase subunit A [Ignavibacteria bacterium]MBK6877141.1 F0F1 ATP synthase subunit A [Ignavibacteria bacterium]
MILSTRSITNKFFLPALVAVLLLSSASLFASDDPKGGKETLDIIDKVVDHHYIDLYFLGKVPLPHFEPVEIFGIKFDFSITKATAMVFLASIITILILAYAASSNKKNKIPKGIGNMIEAVVVFIRDEIVVANMGKDGLKYMPFFLTMFFFVLFANLIGLFPFLAQPTKNINITAALALITFFMTQAAGIKAHGFGGYVKNLVPPGVPTFVLPIMIVVEFIGLFTKPFSLMMRLFANITAGSIIIFSLIGLIFVMEYAGSVIAVPFALFIYMMEIFIAFLQAYIFTMLSVLYINMARHHH